MEWGYRIGLVLLTLLSLVRCAPDEGGEGPLPIFDLPSEQQKEEFLEKFPLLDADGQMSPVFVSGSTFAPLGVLVSFMGGGKAGFCSTSHLTAGRFVVNAHCLGPSSDPSTYYVVYYGKAGGKHFAPATRILYRGSVDSDDIAVLGVDTQTDEDWDIAGDTFLSSQGEIGLHPPVAHSVQMWSFDPFGGHSRLGRRYGSFGMRFHLRQCQASRTRPTVVGYPNGGGSPQTLPVPGDAAIHFFVDRCDTSPVNGNSGSLVTLARDFSQKLGVFHWSVGPNPNATQEIGSYDYTGTDGKTEKLGSPPPHNEFFGVGTDFEAIAATHPGLL